MLVMLVLQHGPRDTARGSANSVQLGAHLCCFIRAAACQNKWATGTTTKLQTGQGAITHLRHSMLALHYNNRKQRQHTFPTATKRAG